MRGKKKLMIEALKSQLGNISTAAKQVGIDRRTHYKWLDGDEEYKREYEEIGEFTVDFVENALFKQINEGNTTAIIFYLKCKAKKRGYVEKSEIEHSTKEGGFKFIMEAPNAGNKVETK